MSEMHTKDGKVFNVVDKRVFLHYCGCRVKEMVE